MPDNTSNRGAQDRARVAGGQTYEVRHFADKHGISEEQAQELIEKHGNSREALDRAAEQLSGR